MTVVVCPQKETLGAGTGARIIYEFSSPAFSTTSEIYCAMQASLAAPSEADSSMPERSSTHITHTYRHPSSISHHTWRAFRAAIIRSALLAAATIPCSEPSSEKSRSSSSEYIISSPGNCTTGGEIKKYHVVRSMIRPTEIPVFRAAC